MSRTTKLVLAVLLGGLLLFAATLGLAATAVYRAGSIAVEVHETDGGRIDVNLPAGLVRLAIALAPRSIVEEATRELAPLLPAIGAAWDEFADAPDFVVAEVTSGDEQIRVEKIDGRLQVRVDSPETRIRVSIPLHAVGALVDRLRVGSSANRTHIGT